MKYNQYVNKCRVEKIIFHDFSHEWFCILSSPTIEQPFAVFVTDTKGIREGSIKEGDEVLVKFITFGASQKVNADKRLIEFVNEYEGLPEIKKAVGKVIDIIQETDGQECAIVDIGIYIKMCVKKGEHQVRIGDYGSTWVYQASELIKV